VKKGGGKRGGEPLEFRTSAKKEKGTRERKKVAKKEKKAERGKRYAHPFP